MPIPGIRIYWQGMSLVLRILVGCFVGTSDAKKRGHNPDHIRSGLILVIIFSLIRARLYRVICSTGCYSTR